MFGWSSASPHPTPNPAQWQKAFKGEASPPGMPGIMPTAGLPGSFLRPRPQTTEELFYSLNLDFQFLTQLGLIGCVSGEA